MTLWQNLSLGSQSTGSNFTRSHLSNRGAELIHQRKASGLLLLRSASDRVCGPSVSLFKYRLHTPMSPSSDAAQHTTEHRNTPTHLSYPSHTLRDKLAYLRFSKDVNNTIAGASAGLTSAVIVCPLDVVKTRLQAQGGLQAEISRRHPVDGMTAIRYQGMIPSLKRIWHEEGVRGMYRGLGPTVLGYLPTWAAYFTIYEKCKVWYGDRLESPWMSHIASALTAGASSTALTNPIWVVKTRLMTQSKHTPWHYNSTPDAIRRMYQDEGIRTFYRGLGPSLLGVTHVAVQFPLYEQFKVWISQWQGNADGVEPGSGAILAASSISKIIASAVTYPHEIIRTRLQTQTKGDKSAKYRGVIQAVRKVYLEEGWRSFYTGMGVNMFRTVPSSALTIWTYELIAKKLETWSKSFDEDEEDWEDATVYPAITIISMLAKSARI
ncbi:hypothetical protein G7K_2656-t1 [Saitoella complicata NRRL Y-17804]|uniref:Mitochondrial thiamine pyrophosphate carrier 1 n=1 Tax=Saitoella complicata (strain BCRC 22490 / CBS 7301 / JCM 7358 / NBRC 10748 / NRRL Y-17804) TaxID=698492 RepID=A0A0E9NF92_SAICN|nr:hypothetical protein G7K_2656-t1 [Saitoella complicata NRRL Y-17804]